jgi:hypothetical protein
MRIIIRNADSGAYFAGEERWVQEHENALAFPSALEAFRHIRGQFLPALRIVFKFDDSRFDFEIAGPRAKIRQVEEPP